MTSKWALQCLPCQAPGDIGSALGLVGSVSVNCDWVRWKIGSATSISMWQHVKLSEQIHPWDTLACCWDVKQPTNKLTFPLPSLLHPSSHPLPLLFLHYRMLHRITDTHIYAHMISNNGSTPEHDLFYNYPHRYAGHRYKPQLAYVSPFVGETSGTITVFEKLWKMWIILRRLQHRKFAKIYSFFLFFFFLAWVMSLTWTTMKIQ